MHLLLGLETSCDETSIAILRDGREVLVNLIASQVDLHARFGGVVPEVASRRHLEVVHPLLSSALDEAGVGFGDLTGVAVTHGPGLIGAVLVGVAVAKGLAFSLGVPLIGVNHLEGHIYSAFLADPALEPPLVALMVSGGHTQLVYMEDHGVYRLLGRTRDDAAGEAFDKVAKLLGLGYPGGPRVQEVALKGKADAVRFPRPMQGRGYEFSFSGLKTAVMHARESFSPEDLCASFQEAAVDVLAGKAALALEETGASRLILVGGVAANARLRERLTADCAAAGVHFVVPPMSLCTDNAAMIARAGWQLASRGVVSDLDLDAFASLPL